MEFLTTFRTRGKEYELYKNHQRDMYLVGNIGCNGTGLTPAYEDYSTGVFYFTINIRNKPVLRSIPGNTIKGVGSL